MTDDEELIARLRDFEKVTVGDARDAADRIEALEAKLAQAVEVLEWYADKCNYETFHEDLPCDCCTDIYEPVMRDEGETARTALAEIKGESHD